VNVEDEDMLLLAKYKARQQTNYAVKQGHLKKKPCHRCRVGRVEAHHHDYTKPLEVVWLCKSCHMDLHYWVLSGRLSRRDLTELQSNILDYLMLDPDGHELLSMETIKEEFELPNWTAVSYAIFSLLVKGYLVVSDKVEDIDEEEYMFYATGKDWGKNVDNPVDK
jgi:hypothetical protein